MAVTRNPERFLHSLCRAIIIALLFAQAAFAAQPCITPGVSVASAMSGQMDDDCNMPAVSAGKLCAVKCMDSDQLAVFAAPVVPPRPTVAVLTLPPPPADGVVVAMRNRIEPARDPPKAIRFCSFLI